MTINDTGAENYVLRNGITGGYGINGSRGPNGINEVNGINGTNSFGPAGINGSNEVDYSQQNHSPSVKDFVQEPIAVVGLACRLPDECNTPTAFWNFIERGGIAKNRPPSSRFNIDTHYDGSLKNKTMASPGGMFLQNVDPRDIDAQFFKLSRIEALSMDPQQRQLLEVVYEGLENSGITLEELDGANVGCFVGSFACDYGDMQARDPEDRAGATVVGIGRAMLSNRISHFLNIKGTSMTIDTACSGSLTGLDVACRYLHTGEIDGAIVAGANIYMSPEHVMDHHMGANGTASLSGKCHTFDAKADGYIKAEAVNMVYLKRLSDARRDRDPIRAVIRGAATNSDGWTAGIASPNSEAQAKAIRKAYANAGITDLSQTNYVECHGTGTRAGDAIEVKGVASVFSASRSPDKPLHIGSVKSNIGHSEPAAGISGLMKVVLSLEKGIIPGNPTFITPNPNIDFPSLRVRPSKATTRWPLVPFRRASVNSFGYGGSNAHAIVDAAPDLGNHNSSYMTEDHDFFADEENVDRPYVLTFSANDEQSLRAQFEALDRHLSDPGVSAKFRDLAYTLSEKRTRHYHRGYMIATSNNLNMEAFMTGTVRPEPPKIGYVFTGQGAQWSEMGKDLVATFPIAGVQVEYLDNVLQTLPDPPKWSLIDELTKPKSAEHLRLPEISQPLVTALQLAILAVLGAAGISCHAVVGHSSGEIAAGVAAGYITPEQAIKIAYYRGKATSSAKYQTPVGMLAVGLGADKVKPYLVNSSIEIACVNSPESVTLSGKRSELETILSKLQGDSHFARLLLVDAAYHSKYMAIIADKYLGLLEDYVEWPTLAGEHPDMFSSTIGRKVDRSLGPSYWVQNMVSPVLFNEAVQEMISRPDGVNLLIEIGPSNALAGPINQIKKAISASIEYNTAWKRGKDALKTMLGLAGKLYTVGYPIKISQINKDSNSELPSVIVDLPNYAWNHSTKYWHESEASVDWRFRKFVHHDLLGSKILGTPWTQPVWKKVLKLSEFPWLRDHRLGESVIFPASGYIAMAIEALFQKSKATGRLLGETEVNQANYQLRNVTFSKTLPLEDQEKDSKILLSLVPCSSTKDSWHEFKISSIASTDVINDHCQGLICLSDQTKEGTFPVGSITDLEPLRHSSPAGIWYKAMRNVGYSFGPSFQRMLEVEATAGQRHNRAIVSFEEPASKVPQSRYPLHPASIDSCFQTGAASLWSGHMSSVSSLMLPAMIDELTIMAQTSQPHTGVAVANAEFKQIGRVEDAKRYKSNVSVYNTDNGELLFRLSGLHYHALDANNESHASHTYMQVTWKPDISLTPNTKFPNLLTLESDGNDGQIMVKIGKVIDLIAHKKPSMRLLEASLVDKANSIWVDHIRPIASDVAANCEYHFSVPSQSARIEALTKYRSSGNVDFSVHEQENPFDEVEGEEMFDLIILTAASPNYSPGLDTAMQNSRKMLPDTGYLLVLYDTTPVQSLRPDGFETISLEDSTKETLGSLQVAYFGSPITKTTQTPVCCDEIHLVHFRPRDGTQDAARDYVAQQGWQIVEHSLPFDDVPSESTVLVLEEMFSPLISNLGDEQFGALKKLIQQKCRVLWVTVGGQMDVFQPEHTCWFGTARSLHSEDPTILLMSLDVESKSSKDSLTAIHTSLKRLTSAETLEFDDSEFVERGGLLYVSRIVPDNAINQSEKDATYGPEPQVLPLHEQKSTVRLMSTRTGTLDSLVYGEVTDEPPLEDGRVEVEVHAAAMNFKDLAHAMGFVASNEQLLGLECTGFVTQVGNGVESVKVGDRVLVVRKDGGAFANRVRSDIEGVHRIPDWMSFEEGTTLGVCFLTAIYSLIDLANTQRGQTVLIHAAAGGVGLASIQIARYLGAEIYVTVGSEKKREFLKETCGIPEDHMFSSRSVTFAPKLMKATNGRGVDVILNSLAGDMLHESWRCIGENGIFVEIGKKDLLDRNSLSMEPFCWNASYRAFDLSLKCVTSATMARLMSHIFKLVDEGHVKPLHIGETFSFENIPDAFRYIRDGKQIGKIVISDKDRGSVKVPIRPALPTLRLKPEVSYLIVGGFKGLCGSLAIYLARQGAKNLVVLSRSGYGDELSQGVIVHLKGMGTHIDLIRGDVTKEEDVRRVFASASKPIAGIIQGAMVLRDKIFPAMTAQEFREPIDPKVRGTIHLHNISLEQSVPLDFFTMLSSVSGVVGQKAQANYSAGNVFQDSFAVYRKSMGLPASAVNLGVIEGVGYFVEREDLSRRLQSQGWSLINEALLHKILHFSILQQSQSPINPKSTTQLITGIPAQLVSSSPLQPHHRFSALRPGASSFAAAETGDTHLNILKNAGKDQNDVDQATILASAVEVVNGVLMRSLGMKEPLEASRPLGGYGIDSLVAVELRNWVRSELGVEISALEVVGAKTLVSLCELILKKVQT